MKKTALLAAIMSAFVLTACGNKGVSFATLEDARASARGNAEYNAQMYRQGNAVLQAFSITVAGDSTQEPSCPQGDGWATETFVSPAKNQLVKVKCSTVSASLGCMSDEEFKSKPFAGDDGHCQPVTKVPFPLPKLNK
jgi:hypothetical protein